MNGLPLTSGPVFSDDKLINLFYLNELYGNLARQVSGRLSEAHPFEVPITSGIWGGTYLIADPRGKSRRRIWRLYCIANLPQNSALDQRDNLERMVSYYCDGFAAAFEPYGLKLSLKMWGGRLPYSCSEKPSITMHMEDASDTVRWLRVFFVWNHVPWEQSIIYDTVRILKEYKEFFDLDKGPVLKPPQDLKYLLQDIIIIYRTLEQACSEDFREHADPIIEDLMRHFMEGLHDPATIQDLYIKVFKNALIYGYEEALSGPFSEDGLDIRRIEEWPIEKINWVPEALREKLIPPIQQRFAGFKSQLDNA